MKVTLARAPLPGATTSSDNFNSLTYGTGWRKCYVGVRAPGVM